MKRFQIMPVAYLAVTVCWIGASAGAEMSPQAHRAPTSAATGVVADLYVATNGSDAWSCTRPAPNARANDGPCATLAGARDRMRTRLALPGGLARDWTVMIRGGTYPLVARVDFEAADKAGPDHEVTYAAYPGEVPIISGGRVLTGFRVDPGTGFWTLTIPEVAAGTWYFGDLWLNGQRSRWPIRPVLGTDRFRVAARVAPTGIPPYASDPVQPANEGDQRSRRGTNRFGFNEGEMNAAWTNLTDVRIQVSHQAAQATLIPVASVDMANRIVTMNSHTLNSALHPGTQWRRENVFEDLSQPGEHYLDRVTGMLTYVPRPGETPSNATVIAPVLHELIRITNRSTYSQGKALVGNMKFVGLTFAYTNSHILASGYIGAISNWHLDPVAAVMTWGAEHVTFDRTVVEHIGETGLMLGPKTKDSSVTNSIGHDLGASFLIAGDEPAWNYDRWGEHFYRTNGTTANTGNFIVHNNHVYDFGITINACAGLLVGRGVNNRITHNTVHGGPSFGIMFGYQPRYSAGFPSQDPNDWHNIVDKWTHDNYVAYNHVYDLGFGGHSAANDFGAIFSVGPQNGTIVEFNKVHGVKSSIFPIGLQSGGTRARGVDAIGIYSDDESSGMIIRNNLVFDVSNRIQQIKGINHKVYNNIFYTKFPNNDPWKFIDFPLFAYYWKGDFNDDANGMHFHHNIIAWDTGADVAGTPYSYSAFLDSSDRDTKWKMQTNNNLYYQYSGAKIVNFARAPHADLSFSEWQARGQDTDSLINQDPLFVDRSAGNFTLLPQSPALALGFVPFDLSTVGVQ